MGLLLVWISTIIVSKTMDVITTFKIIKDLADEEYKIKPDKLSTLKDELNNNDESIFNKLKSYIPFVNIFNSMLNGLDYACNKGQTLDQMYLLDVIERMDKEEIEEYNKKPSTIRALLITNKDKRKTDSFKPLMDDNKSKAICIDYEKENKFRLLLLYHNLDNKGRIKIDEMRISVSEKMIENKEEYDNLVKSELARIHKLSTRKVIVVDKFIKKLYKCKHKEYMSIGETIVDKKFESEEENIKEKGEKLNINKLVEIRKEKEKLIRERNDILNPTIEEEKKLEKKK